jgi:hypothetical protein
MWGELVNADTFIPSRKILGNSLVSFLLTVRSMLFPVTMSMPRTSVLVQLGPRQRCFLSTRLLHGTGQGECLVVVCEKSLCIFLWLFLCLLWHLYLLLRLSRSGRVLRSTWLGIVPWLCMVCRRVFRGAYLVITVFNVTDNKCIKVGSGNSNISSRHRCHQCGDQWQQLQKLHQQWQLDKR